MKNIIIGSEGMGYHFSKYFIDYILKKQPKLDSQDKCLIISKTVLNFFKSLSGIVRATSMVECAPSADCVHEIFLLCAAVCLQLTFMDLASYPLKIQKCYAYPDVRLD